MKIQEDQFILKIFLTSGTRSQAVLQYRLQAYYELAKAVNATDRLGLGMDSPAGPLVIIITHRKHLVTKSRRETA